MILERYLGLCTTVGELCVAPRIFSVLSALAPRFTALPPPVWDETHCKHHLASEWVDKQIYVFLFSFRSRACVFVSNVQKCRKRVGTTGKHCFHVPCLFFFVSFTKTCGIVSFPACAFAVDSPHSKDSPPHRTTWTMTFAFLDSRPSWQARCPTCDTCLRFNSHPAFASCSIFFLLALHTTC